MRSGSGVSRSVKVFRERMSSLSVQARASFWFMISAFIQKGISSLTTPIFTRLMNTEEFGQFGVFNSWLGIIGVFVTLNLYLGVYTQGLVKFSEDRPLFISAISGLISTLCLGFTAVYLAFHTFFNALFHLTTAQMLALLLISWTSAVFSLWAGEQRVLYQYRALVTLSVSMCIIKPLLSMLLVLHAADKVTARILGLALVDGIVCTVLFVRQMKNGRAFFSKKYWLYALKFNLPLLPHYLAGSVLVSADRIMIEDMTGSGNAGIYSLAYSVAIIMGLFGSALMQAITPWLYTKIKENDIQDIGRKMYPVLIMVGAVNILMILFAPEVIRIFAPPEYSAAIWTIPPVAMSVYFTFSYDLFAKFAFYYEKTVFIMTASVISAALNVLLNYLLIPVFGYVAAGYTTLICYIIYTASHYYFMRKVCRECCGGKMPFQAKPLLLITAGFLAVGFLFAFTYFSTWLRCGVLLAAVLLCLGFRKQITEAVTAVLALKKST